jgi:hypothetical protein
MGIYFVSEKDTRDMKGVPLIQPSDVSLPMQAGFWNLFMEPKNQPAS